MKKVLMMLIVLCVFSSCSENEVVSESDRSQLLEKLAKEKAVLRVKNALENENKLMAEGKIDFTNFDHNLVNKEIVNCKTLDESIALYKKAGMENPKEYLLAINEFRESINELKTQVPEIRQLKPNEISQLIRPSKKSHEQAVVYLMRKGKISENIIQHKINSVNQLK
jgi:hypothetical protein